MYYFWCRSASTFSAADSEIQWYDGILLQQLNWITSEINWCKKQRIAHIQRDQKNTRRTRDQYGLSEEMSAILWHHNSKLQNTAYPYTNKAIKTKMKSEK